MQSSAMKFGFLFGTAFAVLHNIGSPVLWALFWAALAAQNAIAARLTWKRTGLRWWTFDMVHATMISAALVPVYLAGYTITTIPAPWMIIFGVNVTLSVAMTVFSRYEDPEKFARWKEVGRKTSFVDFLMFRHIPQLR